jgi:hypothetical protein
MSQQEFIENLKEKILKENTRQWAGVQLEDKPLFERIKWGFCIGKNRQNMIFGRNGR